MVGISNLRIRHSILMSCSVLVSGDLTSVTPVAHPADLLVAFEAATNLLGIYEKIDLKAPGNYSGALVTYNFSICLFAWCMYRKGSSSWYW